MNSYLERSRFCDPNLSDMPNPKTGIVVVIPCFNEPDLLSSLKSLANCHKPTSRVEVITVINSSEMDGGSITNQNSQSYKLAKEWANELDSNWISFHFIRKEQLPKKHAGVGLARKIGMDEAVHRFSLIDVDGIIACFDADSKCNSNYFVELEKHFARYTYSPGCAIYFEHPLTGKEYSAEVYEAVAQYELFLRYYRQGLKYAGLPYAFHTIGSSMAVRCSAYQKVGGMNRRKAGEDFYFLQKLPALGSVTDLNSAMVIPSPRPSDRVPFGTGKAIGNWLKNKEKQWLTYHPSTFMNLKTLVETVPQLREKNVELLSLPESILQFLLKNNINTHLDEIRKNTRDLAAFEKRFYRWFDAFKVLKYVHFARDNYYEQVPVNDAAIAMLLEAYGGSKTEDVKELLYIYRQIDKSS